MWKATGRVQQLTLRRAASEAPGRQAVVGEKRGNKCQLLLRGGVRPLKPARWPLGLPTCRLLETLREGGVSVCVRVRRQKGL